MFRHMKIHVMYVELISVLEGAALHCGGDSGALHLAVMAGVPTVSWFRRYDGLMDWAPIGDSHKVLIGGDTVGDGGISGIHADAILDAAKLVARPTQDE